MSSVLKRKLSVRTKSEQSDEEIIRTRLIFEGDQGHDDRRILTLMKILHSPFQLDKCLSLLYSIDQSYEILKLTRQMDIKEQSIYETKCQMIKNRIEYLKQELKHNEKRLAEAKQRRLNLIEYDQYTDRINQFQTRKALLQQKRSILERKRYFEHLQQTFETTYQHRLKQIAIYLRSIFEFDDILQQDNHEDHLNDISFEQQLASISDRSRTYSDSSIGSLDTDESIRPKKHLISNQIRPYFSSDLELYGTQLVNPSMEQSVQI